MSLPNFVLVVACSLALTLASAQACRPLDGLIDPGCPLVVPGPLPETGPVPFAGLRLILLTSTSQGPDQNGLRNTVARGFSMDPGYISTGSLYQDENSTLFYADVIWPRVFATAQTLRLGPDVLDWLIACPDGALSRVCANPPVQEALYTESQGLIDSFLVLDIEWGLVPAASLKATLDADLSAFLRANSAAWTIVRAINATTLPWAQAHAGLTVMQIQFVDYNHHLTLTTTNTPGMNYPALGRLLQVTRQCASGALLPLCEADDALAALAAQTANLRIALGTIVGVVAAGILAIVKLFRRLGLNSKYLTGNASV